MKQKYSFKGALISNLVPIVFLAFAAFAVPMSGLSIQYLLEEMITRLARDSLLVLSLIIPVLAGMGLNFGMVLGAMAGQIGLVLVVDWGIGGMPALLVAALVGTPISIGLGYFCGYILNLAKGREMVTSYIIGFFMNGAYQFLLLYCMGSIIPISNPELLLSRGYGIRNSMDLPNIRQVLDRLVSVNIFGMNIPIVTFAVIAAFCVFIVWFKGTKIGQDMRAVGRNRAVANGAGIPVEKTRIMAIIISTLIACYGQIVSLQNLGTINTYNSHEQVGIFSIAALLVGGATAENASIVNVFLGVFLFHLMFVVSPMAGKNLLGDAQLGEYFRVFVSYGIIAVSLLLHAWKKRHEMLERRLLENSVKE
ncbi:MAG: ABC transporter permease [Rectinema sp.]|jgi:simple sugar transport system permease protein|uniref:Permease component of ribose/xylose/arabinose/galactoside ABC-type transporter n=1 Tax=uncultured spirochete TaxID=156406 RepID=A0A3P3XQF4_9SPIR|nr:Permease component of ribose/xylose/arabinose/galactoside ABC-type transporter [uncultured spirochete]